MAYQNTWNYQGANIPGFMPVPAERGAHGGLCGNSKCANAGADWYNRGSNLYYCDECARQINEDCLMLGTRKSCELQA